MYSCKSDTAKHADRKTRLRILAQVAHEAARKKTEFQKVAP